MLVFGLDSREFAYRRLVVVDGARAKVMAGDRSGKRLGEVVGLGGRAFTVEGIYHSGDRFEDSESCCRCETSRPSPSDRERSRPSE